MINLKRTKKNLKKEVAKNKTGKLLIALLIIISTILLMNINVYSFTNEDTNVLQNTEFFDQNFDTSTDETTESDNSSDLITSTSVESITANISDETLSFTNLLLIVVISVNIVLLLLAIIILMQINKKI